MYTIQYKVAYEGIQEVYCDSLSEVRAWIASNRSDYDWDLSNIEVFTKTSEDVYELMDGYL